jgi:hypothetical protein
MPMRVLSFLQTRSARRWIPLPLSILIHVALIAGLIYGYRNYRDRSDASNLQRATVPDVLLVEDAKVGGVDQSHFTSPPIPRPMQSLIPSLPSGVTIASHSPSLPPALAQPISTGGSADSHPLIGLPVSAPSANPVGITSSSPGPTASFMGISGDAIRIIFVCDASGSMMDRLPSLQAQLRNSIDQLAPIQWFNVIFFQYSNAIAVNPKGLIQALPANRSRIEKILPNIQARGNSNPLTAIDLAFSQHPQIIYLLTDGDFEDVADSVTDQKILDQIHRLNAKGNVCVNTILFISDVADLQQDDARGGQAILQKIAAENGGTFKVVVAE